VPPLGADTTSQVYVSSSAPPSSATRAVRATVDGAAQDTWGGTMICGGWPAGVAGVTSAKVQESMAWRANSSPVPAVNPTYAVGPPTAAGTSTGKACVQEWSGTTVSARVTVRTAPS
jgi:hypothetical protein